MRTTHTDGRIPAIACLLAAAKHCDIICYNRYTYTVATHQPPKASTSPPSSENSTSAP